MTEDQATALTQIKTSDLAIKQNDAGKIYSSGDAGNATSKTADAYWYETVGGVTCAKLTLAVTPPALDCATGGHSTGVFLTDGGIHDV